MQLRFRMTPPWGRGFFFAAALALARAGGSAEQPADPAKPAPDPRGSASRPVQQILKVLEAYEPNAALGGVGGNFLFIANPYLYRKDYWAAPPDKNSKTLLPPVQAIADLRDQLKARGIELTMIVPPTPAAVFPDYITNIPWEFERDGRVDVYFPGLLAALRAEGIMVIDPLPELVKARFETGPDGKIAPIYFRANRHWTALGAKIGAKLTADAVRAQAWYGPFAGAGGGAKPSFEEKLSAGTLPLPPGSPKGLTGDAYTYAVQHKIIWGTENAPFLAPARGEALVHLIGDSFAGTHAEGDSSFHEFLAAELHAPVAMTWAAGNGHKVALRKWAATADLTGCKAVVWQIGANFFGDGLWPRVRLDRSNTVALIDRLPESARTGAEIAANDDEWLFVVGQRAVLMNFPAAASGDKANAPRTASALWKGVKLGAAPLFRSDIGVKPPGRASKLKTGPKFSLRAGGKLIETREVKPAAFSVWAYWEADLAQFANQTIDLELRVEAPAGGEEALARWGEPELWDASIPAAP